MQSNTQIIVNRGTTGDLIVYSHWVPNSYEITFDLNGGTGENIKIQGDCGSKISKPDTIPTREGYIFDGNWYKDVDCTDIWDFNIDTVPATSITLYAGWTSGTNTVTLPNSPVNGYDFTTNVSEGFDASDVTSGSDFRFDITFQVDLGNYVPVINWNGNTKCPDSKNGLTYQFTISNVTSNLTLSLSLVDTTSLKDLVSKTNSSDYKLSFDGNWTLTVEILKPSATTSNLFSSLSDVIGNQILPINPNSGRTGTSFLAYLPDDDTLWENNLAEYVVEVAGYKFIFKQDADAIEEAKIQYLTEIAQAVRVFRNNPDVYPITIGSDSKSYSEILSVSVGLDDGAGYKYIDIGVLETTYGTEPIMIMTGLSTNYSTVVALVGHKDAKYGFYDLGTNPTGNKVELGKNITVASDMSALYTDAKEILKRFNMPITDLSDPLSVCFDMSGNGYGGYGKYCCISEESGIRYTDIYHLKFSNYFDNAAPTLHTITVSDGISLQNFKTHNELVDIPFTQSLCDLTGARFDESDMINIYNYEYNQLLEGELIVVNSSSADGTKIIGLTITDSAGNDITSTIQWYDGSTTAFIMPDKDITISPIFSK